MDSLSDDAGIRIRGGLHSYKLPKQETDDTNVLSFFFPLLFPLPFLWGVLQLI